MKQQRFDGLTGLKGLFSLLIVFYHTLPNTPLIQKIPLTSFIGLYGGSLGNCFFFLTSGFLLTFGYRDRILRRELSFRDFLVRRLCRLYPLYLLTNGVVLLISILKFGVSAIDIKKILFTVLLQNGGGLEQIHPYNGPSWYISALFVCYLLYYFLTYHSRHTTAYRCFVALGIIWGYSILSGRLTAPLAFAHHGDSIFSFFTGCALAELWPTIARKDRGTLQLAAAMILAAAMGLMLGYGIEIIAGDSKVAFAWLVCPLLIYLAVFCKPLSAILCWKPIHYLGTISFSVYLWHFVVYPAFQYVHEALFPGKSIGEPQYLVYLALMFAVSILSHHFLEDRISPDPAGNRK